ncbi:MAG TPA: hypothetical protein VN770_11105 [Gaiellaceae bacterium]|nr:hypothetical protein [Gaiellaceae bacterium]
MIAAGLALAVVSAVAIGGGYALQHSTASRLPRLTLRRPLHSLASLLRSRRWAIGFFGGIAGWALYVEALRLAPLSLVQAASAGGIGVLAFGGARLSRAERIGVGAALAGLMLLAVSVGSHPPTGRGNAVAVAIWMGASLAVAAALARFAPSAAGLGTAAGVLYAAGDVGTKAAVVGGGRLLFVPALLACHGLAFVCMQLAFQRGGRLASAGLAVLWTNALPIAAGTALFAEALPGGVHGGLRIAAFALVLVGAVALSRRSAVPEAGSIGGSAFQYH